MDNTDIDAMELDALASFNDTLTTMLTTLSAFLLLTAASLDNNDETPRRRRRQRDPSQRKRRTTEYRRFRFNLDNLSNQMCTQFFRFNKDEIRKILPYMGLSHLRYRNRLKPSEELAMCIWLNRLSWPNRIHDMPRLFGVSPTYISVVYNDVMWHFHRRFTQFLRWDPERLTVSKIRQYAEVIGEGGKVWAFIDGTTQQICRPGRNQEVFYTGHKAFHGYKWQGIVTPDGLCSSLAGPKEGSTSDWLMYEHSGIDETINSLFNQHGIPLDRRPLIYGDAAYTSRMATMGPWRRPARGELSPEKISFNQRLSKKRVAVENFFSMVQAQWTLGVMRICHRLGSTPVALTFQAGVFLQNCMSCLRQRNQVSLKYGIPPPTLEEYLALFETIVERMQTDEEVGGLTEQNE